MNESEYQALVEISWRRRLTPEEQAQLEMWLVQHPEIGAAWESEAGLNQLLEELPAAPISSNFTAQVLHGLSLETNARTRATSHRSVWRWWHVLRLGPRIAWALLLTTAVWFGWDQHRDHVREQVAQGLTVVANVASLSDPVALQDFEAIQRLSQSAPSDDEELFTLLTQ